MRLEKMPTAMLYVMVIISYIVAAVLCKQLRAECKAPHGFKRHLVKYRYNDRSQILIYHSKRTFTGDEK